jgi:hypothetical protein
MLSERTPDCMAVEESCAFSSATFMRSTIRSFRSRNASSVRVIACHLQIRQADGGTGARPGQYLDQRAARQPGSAVAMVRTPNPAHAAQSVPLGGRWRRSRTFADLGLPRRYWRERRHSTAWRGRRNWGRSRRRSGTRVRRSRRSPPSWLPL